VRRESGAHGPFPEKAEIGRENQKRKTYDGAKRQEEDIMKTVRVYSAGSCNAETRKGSARVLIEKSGSCVRHHFHYRDTTANRCVIQGLIDGVAMLDGPHHVKMITSVRIGVVPAEKVKGPNRDLVSELLKMLSARGCQYELEYREGEAAALNKYIHSGTNKA